MQLTRWQRFWKLDVPNSMIPLLWNCMMSVGGGWFFLTASEMISVNNRTYALPGLGSFVAVASEHEQLGKVLWAIVTMVIVVLLIDVLLWKPLTAWAEKFRITQNESVQAKTSLVLSVLRRSGISDALALVGRPIANLMFWLTRPLGVPAHAGRPAGTRRRTLDIAFMALMAVACLAGLWMLVRFISDGEGFAEVGHAMVLGLITFMRVTLLTVVCSIIWVPIGVKIGHESADFPVRAAAGAGVGELPLELHVPVRHTVVHRLAYRHQLGQHSAHVAGNAVVHPVQRDCGRFGHSR